MRSANTRTGLAMRNKTCVPTRIVGPTVTITPIRTSLLNILACTFTPNNTYVGRASSFLSDIQRVACIDITQVGGEEHERLRIEALLRQSGVRHLLEQS